jgi:hypothetical protein
MAVLLRAIRHVLTLRGAVPVPSLIKHFWPCLSTIIESVNNAEKITYGQLAEKLGLKSAQQEWHTVLDPIAKTA